MRPPRRSIVITITLHLLMLAASCSDAPAAQRRVAAPTDPVVQATEVEKSPLQEPAEAVIAELVHVDGRPFLNMRRGDRELISPGRQPLYTPTDCTVSVQGERIAEGILLRFTLRNDTDAPAESPDFYIAGIDLPRTDVEILENWKNVRFKEPLARNQNQLHALRSYPSDIYSPVMGIRAGDAFIGSSMMYRVFDEEKEVTLDYRYSASERTWSMRYRFWDERNMSDPATGRTNPAVLAPDEQVEFSIAVTFGEPAQWIHAFRPYRDFFRENYGEVRYKRSREPIYALSMGLSSRISSSNPKGYLPSGPTGNGRLDLIGWRGFYRHMMEELDSVGYRRFLLWQVAGSYDRHPETNMVWEITTSWSPAMNETAHELRRLQQAGISVGLWWGRAFSISGGFDSGHRHAWDPSNPADNEAAFRELDRAYDMGVRIIGLDATPRGIFPGKWTPSSRVLFREIFPKLHDRYPEMHWIIEPAACDYLHVWGSSFMWAGDVSGPTTFADYLLPGHESHAVLKSSRPLRGQEDRASHMNLQLFNQLIEWGYTPIVFSPGKYGLKLPREP